jgi:hypothetical protein
MLRYLYDKFATLSGRDADCFINLRQLTLVETDIQYGSDDLGNLTSVISCHFYLFPAFIKANSK